MFSAKSDGLTYVAGRITEPKSREYTCPACDEPVSHVNPTVRSGEIRVSEHFRHRPGADIAHPHRKFTWQSGNIMSRLLDNFAHYDHIDVETDSRFTHSGLDFVVDMLVTENIGSHRKQTAILSQAGPFRAEDYLEQWAYLSANEISLLTILSAQGTVNPNGKYCRTQYRRNTGQEVNMVAGNEKMLFERQGKLVYFHHDTQSVELVGFKDYKEYYDNEYTNEHGFTISAGPRSFETLKTAESEKLIQFPRSLMGITHWTTGRGFLIARPESYVDYMFSLEERAKSLEEDDFAIQVGERIAMILDGCDTDKLKELSRRYGRDRLGGYYTE